MDLLLLNEFLLEQSRSVEVGEGLDELMALHEDGTNIVEANTLLPHVFEVLEDVEGFVVVEQRLRFVSFSDGSSSNLDCFGYLVES